MPGTIEKVDVSMLPVVDYCHFTRPADLRRMVDEDQPARVAHVTFSEGAQTDWHRHGDLQWLFFTNGEGEVATGRKTLSCRTGDLVRVDGNVRHRHGAAAGHIAAHFAITVGETYWEKEC